MPIVNPTNHKSDHEDEGSPYALNLGTAFGIPIRLHFTFLLLLVYFAFTGSGPGRWHGLIFVMILFGCVVLHELGHSVVAQRFGVNVSEIVLYPIGGVARLERMPKPAEEFWIALAGPAVNVVIALMIYIYLTIRHTGSSLVIFNLAGQFWWQSLLTFNLVMIGFNMIPAFPMDGGRVLRSILAMRMDEYRATQIAATIGQLLAFVFAFVGLVSGTWSLLFIAFFVYIGAGQEANAVRGKTLLQGLRVREAMVTEFSTLPSGATLAEARDMLLHSSQTEFPIVNGDQVLGVLSRTALLQGLATVGDSSYVAESMDRDFPTAEPEEELEEIAMDMQAGETGCVLVMDGDKLVGMITKENIGELLIIRQIMRRTETVKR